MASVTPKESHSIENIEMDAFGVTADRLATEGVGPCIHFVIILNGGREVFLEHRSDTFLSQLITTKNVALCLQDLAEHIRGFFTISRYYVSTYLRKYIEAEKFSFHLIKNLFFSMIRIEYF